jgi:phage shock protein A
MILGKLWRSLKAQLNKLANWFAGVDPIAEMQYEYDRSVEQIKEGREGLAQYRALVERVVRQVEADKKHVATLEAKIKAYLQTGDRDTAAKFALELQKAKQSLEENEAQLKMHDQAYNNHLLKIKHATAKLAEVQERIHKYDSELKMSRAEAEVAELAKTFKFDVTTDFGKVEENLQRQIDTNRARVRVASDLSGEGLEEVQKELALEKALAQQALEQFEKEAGLTPALPGPEPHKALP